jgi:hypothetical protein
VLRSSFKWSAQLDGEPELAGESAKLRIIEWAAPLLRW